MVYADDLKSFGPNDRAGSIPVSPTSCCTKCGSEVPNDNFSYKNKKTGKRQSVCKTCTALYANAHYAKNAETYKRTSSLSNQKIRVRNKAWVHAQKVGRACVDCKGLFPAVCMDFDHREGTEKVDALSRMMITSMSSIKRMQKEILKCDLVCSNCHRIRTYRRFHGTDPN